jgi:hypothetical protein
VLCARSITPDIWILRVSSLQRLSQQNQQLNLVGGCNAIKSRDLKIGGRVRSPPPVHPGYGAVDAALERCQLLRGHLVHPHERKWRDKNGAEADAVPHRSITFSPLTSRVAKPFSSCCGQCFSKKRALRMTTPKRERASPRSIDWRRLVSQPEGKVVIPDAQTVGLKSFCERCSVVARSRT